MRPEEQNDTAQNSVNYFQQPSSQPVVPPVTPVSPVSQVPQQMQQQPSQQPQSQQYIPNNQPPTPPTKKKSNIKLIAIIAAILLLLGLGIFVLLGFLNKDGSKTNTTSGNSSNTASGEDTSGGTVTGTIIMDKQIKTFSSAFFSMKYPETWGEFQRFQNVSIFGPSSERITKDINGGEKMPLYYMAVSDILELDPPKYAGWTFNDAWARADEKITEGSFSTYSGKTLIGTETSKKEVTVGGVVYTKIIGKTTDGYMQANYIAYIGFYTNENRHASRVPIAIVMFIASDNASDIAYGETVLNACMATIKPRK